MPSEPPSRKRPLTAEEAELWQHAMRQAKGLRRRERERRTAEERTRNSAGDAAGKPQHGAAPATPPPPEQTPKPVPKPPRPIAAPAAAIREAATPLAQFDERQRRKLSRDAAPIEARLDLHGMRQREAHDALVAFLRSCAAKGLRHVLVITGKGAPEGHSRDFLHPDERGVLRRVVPHWMSEPGLRDIVVSYTAAHVRHGGQGALYVHLRKAPPRG